MVNFARGNVSQTVRGGVVRDECPDPHAGLQVSMCIDYDLSQPG